MAELEFVVDFPTLGDLIDAWVERHCVVPNGFMKGRPFKMSDWQFWCTANHYRVRDDAVYVDPADATDDNPVLLNQAFFYRRSQVIAPQKTGKGPWAASIVAVEAAGPSLFAGWAVDGDAYYCEDNGCPCGWVYPYMPGEPKGMRHPSPLIQLTATSEEQVGNVYRPLTGMIRKGRIGALMKIRENFIRITGLGGSEDDDRIDKVTSSARARLGNPITFAVQDETGTYTNDVLRSVADDQRRGAAGMGGRTIETTNAFDPTEDSTAQRTFEARAEDIFRFYRKPPANLSYLNKRERRKIHEYVYAGSPWVSLDSIEAEAAELLERDPAQAERFFGNRMVQGAGAYLTEAVWDAAEDELGRAETVCLGFDGSSSGDWTAIRAETLDGVQFTPTYGPDGRPTFWNPAEWGGRIPRGEVQAAVAELFDRYRVKRMYCDPRDWRSEIDAWSIAHGEEVVVEWPTNSIGRTFDALNRFQVDLETRQVRHDGCPTARVHALNARKLAKPGDKYILGKPSDHQKIDVLMASVLAHEAAADSRSAGWGRENAKVLVFR